MSSPAAAGGPNSFLEFLRGRGAFTTDDALATLLPLFRQVAEVHAAGRVAPLEGVADLRVEGYRVYFEAAAARLPRLEDDRVRKVEGRDSALDVVGQRTQTTDADAGDEEHRDLQVATGTEAPERPLFLSGYVSWEHRVGHHDALTDVYVLGLLLASVACGFDFTDGEHVRKFAAHRSNLFPLAPHLNPVLAKNIVRMTELERHRRAQDLSAIIRSLETYRDQRVDGELDLGSIQGFHSADLRGRRRLVLSRLRERLFEITRRNRLLYFKPTLQTLNLTFASVPILFDVRSIRTEQIFTWHADVEKMLAEGSAIPLSRYLRFEDAPYVRSVLDKLISEARRDTAEFGFSQLRLVIAFLRWNNLKETPPERIDSPILLVPVELTRKKGVRDSYVVRATTREAEVNPILRYHLKQLYDITLPHSVDLSETTVQAFFETLSAQIQASEPGVLLSRLDRPQVDVVYAKARRRLDQYRRRIRTGGFNLRSFGDLDYSYRRDNYQPLGLRLFLGAVRPSPAPLHDMFRSQPIHTPHMAATPPGPSSPPPEAPVDPAAPADPAKEAHKEKTFVAFREGADAGNPYAWEFDLCNLTLGNFNYRKMSLVRDYDSLIGNEQASGPFESIFSLAPRPTDTGPPPDVDLSLRFPVVHCDPTQLRALAVAQTGRSYIIQGPPGTGKSQTITNLVADLLAQGKRILFVCEKRAAIDVVYHRLRQRGLHDLVCLIHDSQADKREFVMDLKSTYERALKATPGASTPLEAERTKSLSALDREMKPIAGFESAMRAAPADAGVPLRALLVRLIALSDRVPELSPEDEDALPPYRVWVESRDAIEALQRALPHACPDGVYARHPLAALSPDVAAMERPRAILEERLRGAVRLLDAFAAACRQHGIALGEQDTLARSVTWTRYAAAVKPLADRALLGLLDPESAVSAHLRDAVRERQARFRALEAARTGTAAWRQKLERDDLAIAIERARALAGSLLRLFKGDYWQMRRLMAERYDFARHAIRPSWVQVLEKLQAEYQASDALAASDAAAHDEYGMEGGAEKFAETLDGIRGTVRDLFGGGREDGAALRAATPQVVAGLVALSATVVELERLLGSILSDPLSHTMAELRAMCGRLTAALPQLPDWLPCLAALADLPPELARVFRSLPLPLPCVEAALASKTLDETWRRDRGLARFGGPSLEAGATRIERHHARWLETNAGVVIERTHQRFLEHVALSSLPSIRLTKEQDELKRRYNAGRRELEHEFGKTMRYKSVRGLLAGPAGEVIVDLKPVWLMSPLSVSDTLPIDTNAFDVVIFDEASQVPLEEAVPALFRADQVIVSGDQMQLPPTNFFSATRRSEDNLLLEDDDEGDAVEYELDVNSFLSHTARTLPSTMLGWHYRSRSESLISFSNAAFYDGGLLTVPERRTQGTAEGAIVVTDPEQGDSNAARLLARPVSFHRLEQGRYENRRNGAEARYIAHLVRGLLAGEARPSIGIVAFSEAQQGAIEAALDALAAPDAEFRGRLEEEYEREEDGQFAGLLVKNLENIQGDERDVILLSVCYGYGPDGRMLMNFGPINQSGGEKRLNVAFSRARKHMAVVSSIHYADVKNVYNDGANAMRNYLQYAEAMSAGDARTAAATLRAMNPLAERAHGTKPADDVAVALAGALRQRGLEVELDVGHSRFRCPLAVRRAGDEAYRVAVFIDDEARSREGDILEREVLRPRLLREFGWRVCTVLAKDWLDDAEAVVRRVETRLDSETAVEEEPPAEEPRLDPPVPEASAPEAPAPPVPTAAPAPPAAVLPLSALPPGQTRCFEFVGGSSSKFWHVTVDQAELVVVFGRIGTEGQVKRRAFPTAALARVEAERLIREKLAKGYQEVR